jgi:hypothetical protein
MGLLQCLSVRTFLLLDHVLISGFVVREGLTISRSRLMHTLNSIENVMLT